MNAATETKIILASQSPRRAELLSKLLHDINIANTTLQIMPVFIDESVHPKELPLNYVKRMTKEKYQAAFARIRQEQTDSKVRNIILLTADTVVTFNNAIFGKPLSKSDAMSMLSTLSGNTHSVMTAFSIGVIAGASKKILHEVHDVDTTFVTFRSLSEVEIQGYCDSKEPYDKAGGYGIQGLAGDFVEGISGSFSNVVGLPLEKLQQHFTNVTKF